jgi:hypothetical protein
MIAEPIWLVRTVEVFSNATEELVEEIRLPPVDVRTLQALWAQDSTEPMFDLFQIGDDQQDFFEHLLGVRFDFTENCYFLAAHTTDSKASREAGGFMGRFPPPRELEAFPDARRVVPKTEA